MHLVVAGHAAHRAKKVAEWVAARSDRIELHFLPAYAPHLTPMSWSTLVSSACSPTGSSPTAPRRSERSGSSSITSRNCPTASSVICQHRTQITPAQPSSFGSISQFQLQVERRHRQGAPRRPHGEDRRPAPGHRRSPARTLSRHQRAPLENRRRYSCFPFGSDVLPSRSPDQRILCAEPSDIEASTVEVSRQRGKNSWCFGVRLDDP